MSNLYNIGLEYLRIINLIEEAEGELTEDIAKELKLLQDVKENFINALCQSKVDLDGDVVKIATEIERLQERKKDATAKIESTKKTIVKVLKFFGMRSPNKKSTGYAFNTGLFSGYTRSTESVEVDIEAVVSQFTPIIGKNSEYVKYTVSVKVNHKDLLRLNELGIIPVTSYTPTVDKTSLNEYLQLRAQSHEQSSETDENAVEVKIDPIADYASISSTESLIIK